MGAARQSGQDPSTFQSIHFDDFQITAGAICPRQALAGCLDELDLPQNTVAVLTSANGGFVNAFDGLQVAVNWPLRSGEGPLGEGETPVPGVTEAGSESSVPASSTDYYRTRCWRSPACRLIGNATEE